jgi:hypothetical protein
MSATLLHSRSQLVTREELLTISPPSGTATWRPIAHGDLVLSIERQLTARGISVKKTGDLIALRRRHTARFELDADIARAVGRYESHLLSLHGAIAKAKAAALSAREAQSMIFEVFDQEILPVRHFRRVADNYFSDGTYPDTAPRTLWGLHNACSRVVKDMAPASAFQATVRLGRLFGLTSQASE